MSLFNTLSGTNIFDLNIEKRFWTQAFQFNKDSALPLLFREVGDVIDLNGKTFLDRSVEEAARLFEEIAEGTEEVVTLDPRTVARMKSYSKEYGLGVKVTERVMNTRGKDYILKYTDRFPELAYRTIEKDWVNYFINTGFTFNALRDQRDGVSLYNVAHPGGALGGVYANMPATASAITETSLSTAIGYFNAILDDSGLPYPLVTKKLIMVVHPTRYAVAVQVAKSMSSQTDYKNAGVLSLVKSYTLDITVLQSAYQTSPLQWSLFVMDRPSEMGGLETFFFKQPGTVQKKVNQDPNWLKWYSIMDYGLAVSDPRVAYSNPGA